MQAIPVLMITHDDALWQRWRQIDAHGWMPARGHKLDELSRWRARGRQLVVLDAGVPGLPAWQDAAWPETWRELNVLVTSANARDDEAHQVLAVGASGYLHAYSSPEAMSRVLTSIAAGGIWLGRSLVSRMLREIDRRLPDSSGWDEGLTAREKQVAQRAAMGEANQAIGDALGISERTVRAHLSAIFEKLGVGDRLMLALKVHGIR